MPCSLPRQRQSIENQRYSGAAAVVTRAADIIDGLRLRCSHARSFKKLLITPHLPAQQLAGPFRSDHGRTDRTEGDPSTDDRVAVANESDGDRNLGQIGLHPRQLQETGTCLRWRFGNPNLRKQFSLLNFRSPGPDKQVGDERRSRAFRSDDFDFGPENYQRRDSVRCRRAVSDVAAPRPHHRDLRRSERRSRLCQTSAIPP